MKRHTAYYHQDEHCGCHHEHCHCEKDTVPQNSDHFRSRDFSGDVKRNIYNLENLGCANCAAKMERKINALPGVEQAEITFATKQLCLFSADAEGLLPQIQEICSSIESNVKVVPRECRTTRSDNNTMSEKEERREWISLVIGVVLFVGALGMSVFDLPSLPVFVLSYLVLAKDILCDAVKSVTKGHALDENFLMAIASIGAFLIGEYVEAVAVVMFFCIGELFEEHAVTKSRSQIMDAVDMRPETVNLLVKDAVVSIPAEEAVVGDILLVRPGDRVPLDGVIIEGESRVDTSPVTGEPVPISVFVGSEVISGCINVSGVLKMRVEKPLSESMVTRILDSVEQAAAGKPKIDRFITRFARVYTPFVVALAVATAVIPSLLTGDWEKWVYTALTFLVISCPCALVLSVPLAYFSGIGFSSRLGILFKGGASLEALKKVKAVVMDKTGTVTKGNFSVTRILCADGYSEDDVLSAAASAEMSSNHPIAASILLAAKERCMVYGRPEEVQELAGRGVAAALNGHEIFCGSKRLLAEQNIQTRIETADFYGTEVYVAVDGKSIGMILIADEVKADARAAVKEMTSFGLSTVMLTGDREESAQAVAKETGIGAYRASLLPQDKLTAMEELRKEYGAVMFVGDGINDAPVLAGADVGAAMGSGADAAIEAADVVFMTSEMQAIPKALHIARKVGRIAIQNVIFALGVKFAVMILGLMGIASMWLAIFADTGVAVICIINSIRILYTGSVDKG